MTKNINQQVWNIIQGDASIQKNIGRKLINIRALAKYILKTYDLKASLDAVISSIRRFDIDSKYKKEESSVLSVFKDSVIQTKNKICSVTLAKESINYLQDILKHNFDTMRIITGTKTFKIITEQSNLEDIKSIFPNKDMLFIDKDLSELSIIVNEKALMTKGVMARITSEIALHEINLHDFIVCLPELIILIKQNDIIKTHESIISLYK